MAYTIKMLGDSFDPIQSALDAGDLNLIADGIAGYGIVSSMYNLCLVSPSTPAAMSVSLGNGMVQNGTTRGIVGGGTVAINPPSSQPRIDLISVDPGTFSAYTQGVPSANPRWPAKPAGNTIVAAILVRPDTTAITGNEITNKQILLPWQPRDIYLNNGNLGSSKQLDFSLADHQRGVLNSAICALTFTGAISGVPASMMFEFVQDNNGNRTFTIPSAVKVADGGFFISMAPNARSRVVFMTNDGGTTIDAAMIGNNYA